MNLWSLTISPGRDGVRGEDGYIARCSCGYASPLQFGDAAFRNVAMAAAQHLEHRHGNRPGDPRLDAVGLEVTETKAGWAWRCHICDEQEFGRSSEEDASSRAAEHGRSYRHHRRAA